MNKKEVLELFPSPYFRKYQKETIEKMVDAFNSGVKCILLGAPTGSGKSFINTTFCRYWTSFYATPQLSLIDQIKRDPYLTHYFVELKGRQNYYCAFDPSATVDVGVCRRRSDFNCPKDEVCPYWIQKLEALKAQTVLMSFAYLLLEGKTKGKYSLGSRELLVLDEAHSIDRYLIDYVNFVISPWNLPFDVYQKIEKLLALEPEDFYELTCLVSAVHDQVEREAEFLKRRGVFRPLTLEEVKELNRLEDWSSKAEVFLSLSDRVEWIWDLTWTKYRGKPRRRLVVKPVYAGIFGKELLWWRADRYIVSSATILDPEVFVEESGLDKVLDADEVIFIEVPSTFPVINRPVIDATNGKLTVNKKEENFPWAVEILEKILDIEEGKNIAVHCHSYDNARRIYEMLDDKYKDRIVLQTPETREEDLKKWMNSRGKVFLCVAFTEGQDWVGDICEAQVLFKVPFPDLSDKRVAKRLEKKEWKWYYNEALKQVIQAYGRAVRRDVDKARFYVIDKSFVNLIRRCRRSIPEWFRKALPRKWGGELE